MQGRGRRRGSRVRYAAALPAVEAGRTERGLRLAARALLVVVAAAHAALLLAILPINASSPGGRYADPLVSDGSGTGAAGGSLSGAALSGAALAQAGSEYRALLHRLERLDGDGRIRLQVIGEARYGGETYPMVALTVASVSGGSPPARVLVTAGVHGNEIAGVESVTRFLEHLDRSPREHAGVAFDVVPVVNPWGWVHRVRQNGAGKDVNRDFASSRTQESAVLRRFLADRVDTLGPYDLTLDHHESTKPGYFIYQYTARGLGDAYVALVRAIGGDIEEGYREGAFRVREGVLAIPAVALPYLSALGRLSLEQYMRREGTRHAYTLESPLGASFVQRVRVHYEAIDALTRAYLRRVNRE